MPAKLPFISLTILACLVLSGCQDREAAVDAAVEAGAGVEQTSTEAPDRGPEVVVEAGPRWSFDPELIFPADRSLSRPEDGVALPDGRLIVADQAHGLRLLRADGSHRPFGRFAEAGYVHRPPHAAGGANGVTLEPDGTHILVADVHHGGIYRVDVGSEETELLYQHPFGVNVARRDTHGGIWFTQSTRNTPEVGEEGLLASLARPVPDGAIYYLPPARSGEARSAERVVDSLYFANGIALDEAAGQLYVAELMARRVLSFRMDMTAGWLGDRAVALEVPGYPDNLELDSEGRLWIAAPLRNEILVHDLESGDTRSVFRISTPRSEALIREMERRAAAGMPWLDLMGPELWEPGPGSLTGVILAPGNGPVYVTNLGNALIRLER